MLPPDQPYWLTVLGFVWILGAMFLLAQVVWSSRRLNAELARQPAVVNPVVGAVLAEAQDDDQALEGIHPDGRGGRLGGHPGSPQPHETQTYGHTGAFSPDSGNLAYVYAGDDEHHLRVADLRTKEFRVLVIQAYSETIEVCDWSPDGTRFWC